MDNGLTDLAFKTAAMETKRSKKREALGMETGSINEQDREREREIKWESVGLTHQ